ncbi:MAG: lipase family alpha/beta hydrolase [Burkholderiaceae bacterium]
MVLAVRLTITANNFRLAIRYADNPDAWSNLGLSARCRLLFGEWRATLYASSWSMAFPRRGRFPTAAPDADCAALLVHGYGCNAGFWRPLGKVLLAAGVPHCAITLEPAFGSIDDYAAPIADAVRRLQAETGARRIVVVAHSMGGLALRACLRQDALAAVTSIVTLGTPHHGTVLARYGLGKNCRQMARPPDGAGEWLRRLADAETPALRARFVSIRSRHDNIVAPQASACLQGARNIALDGIGHVEMGSHPRVLELVMAEIARASAAASRLAAH